MTQPAPEGARFAPDAFAAQVGTAVPFTVSGQPHGEATVVAAEVAADGSSVRLTFESPAALPIGFRVTPQASAR